MRTPYGIYNVRITLVAIAGNQGAYNNNEGIRGTLIRNKLLEVIRCRMSWYQLMMLHLKC